MHVYVIWFFRVKSTSLAPPSFYENKFFMKFDVIIFKPYRNLTPCHYVQNTLMKTDTSSWHTAFSLE